MKEIKFRIRFKDAPKPPGGFYFYTFYDLIDPIEKFPSQYIILSKDSSTDLKDKNGKEVYEGDIIRIDNDGEEYVTYVREEQGFLAVDVIGHDYTYTAPGWLDAWCEIEVIGNIYENPELLDDVK